MKSMDEKRKLTVIEKSDVSADVQLEEKIEEVVAPKISHKVSHPNQTSPISTPILKNLAKFANAKIGGKLSVKDLIR